MAVNWSLCPNVLIGEIHCYLTPYAFASNERVCRQWRSTFSTHLFWKNRCDTQRLPLVENFSYKRRAFCLFAKATLKSDLPIRKTPYDEAMNEDDLCKVPMHIYNFSNELMSLQEKIRGGVVFFVKYIPLKFFIKEDGRYKTTGDQVVINYNERDLVLKLHEYKRQAFDKALQNKIKSEDAQLAKEVQ